jgi:hypothetical protein
MHIAVDKGAKANQAFLDYINYLADKGYIPPDGRVWVDYIRQRSNEANHEIVLMSREDAVGLVSLTEMLLRLIYELPNLAPATQIQLPAPTT